MTETKVVDIELADRLLESQAPVHLPAEPLEQVALRRALLRQHFPDVFGAPSDDDRPLIKQG